MPRRRVKRLLYRVAVAGTLMAATACGALTGVGLLDLVGVDGGGSDDGATSCDGAGEPCCDGAVCADAAPDAGDAAASDGRADAAKCSLASRHPSCVPEGPGKTNCGASEECCCDSLEVSGGTFFRTYLNEGDGLMSEFSPATVSSFRLDKYLVTVGRFREFTQAWNGGMGYAPPAGSGKHTHLNGGQGLVGSGTPGAYEPGWLTTDDGNIAPTEANLSTQCKPYVTWSASPKDQETLPISCVNWYEAYAFCIWDGGFLPSEAESEYASAGGAQQREYPWGQAFPGYLSQYAIYNCYYPTGSPVCKGTENIAPVGTTTMGAGLWGHLDLAGEVEEWTLDWSNDYLDPCVDCAAIDRDLNDAEATGRVIRGGTSAYVASSALESVDNFAAPPGNRGLNGFRCARVPTR